MAKQKIPAEIQQQIEESVKQFDRQHFKSKDIFHIVRFKNNFQLLFLIFLKKIIKSIKHFLYLE